MIREKTERTPEEKPEVDRKLTGSGPEVDRT